MDSASRSALDAILGLPNHSDTFREKSIIAAGVHDSLHALGLTHLSRDISLANQMKQAAGAYSTIPDFGILDHKATLAYKMQAMGLVDINAFAGPDSVAYTQAMKDISAFGDMKKFSVHSSALSKIEAARLDFASMFLDGKHMASAIRDLEIQSSQWESQISNFDGLVPSAIQIELTLKSHFLSIADTDYFTHQRLSAFPWESLGQGTTLPPAQFSVAGGRFNELAGSYRTLARSYQKGTRPITAYPPIASAGPADEVLANTIVLEALSRDPANRDEDDSPTVSTSSEQRRMEIEESVIDLVSSISPSLLIAYTGAREALVSSNPDRVRHVIVSLRELVTQVLHTLAPNDRIQAWSSDPTYYYDGKPTRAARIYYICRAIYHAEFSDFVKADVKASLACIDLFQRGTHQLNPAFSGPQLSALVTRTETLLRFLIITSRTAD
jgi:hypothetical protein